MEEQKRIQSRESNRQKTEAAKQEIERVRREAREADPAFAEARCAEAKAKEREILRKDPTADLAPPLALFRARQLQDLYCKEYKARSLPPSLR
jgi:hypothetical protein